VPFQHQKPDTCGYIIVYYTEYGAKSAGTRDHQQSARSDEGIRNLPQAFLEEAQSFPRSMNFRRLTRKCFGLRRLSGG
jgi:hypothetical protein